MSIENTLERIANALEAMVGQPPVPAPAAVQQPEPVATPAPAAPPVPPPAASSAPFTDTAGLIKYVTETYKALGPEKGMHIQAIMQQFGYDNINAIPVEKFGEFHTAIEQLKAA